MKTTHSIQDIEGLMYEYADKIKNAETKTEKQALYKRLKSLEKHYNNCNEKNLNGKKYPKKVIPKDTPKKELLALIDEVPDGDDPEIFNRESCYPHGLDVSGVFTKDALAESST